MSSPLRASVRRMTNAGLPRRVLTGVAALAMVGVFGIVALLALLWLERRTEVTLPALTGPFGVGRVNYAWSDSTHVDQLAPRPGTKRELLAWIWYPSAPGQSVAMADYIPAQMRSAVGPGSRNVMTLLTRDASMARAHSMRDADLSPQAKSYPVVIMRGGASAGVVGYSTLAEDLASHGYVVVGFDAPYRTNTVVFPDGRVMRRTEENNPEICVERALSQQDRCMQKLIAAWTSDVGFALDQLDRMNTSNTTDGSGRFQGRLDLTRVGVFGHSLGGATAAQFCHDDSRCTAGIDIDGQPFGSVITEGLQQPFMFLLSDHGTASDTVSRRINANIQSIYDRLPVASRLRISIRGANHFTFSDDGGLLKSRLVRGMLRLLGVLAIDGDRQLAVTAYCVHSFFDRYVKGGDGSRLQLSSPLYPELQILE